MPDESIPADPVDNGDSQDSLDGAPVQQPVDAVDSDPSAEGGAELFDFDPAQGRLAEVEQQLSEVQARLRAVSAAYQKQQEEVDQVRQRLERQAAIKEEMRRGEVVVDLFDPVQNLKRSIEAAQRGASMEDTTKGLELVHGQFLEAFRKLGLEEVPGKGARFDPNLHEALTTVPVTDPALDDVVIDVFSTGYRIGSRLVTAARVVVGRLAESAAEA